MSSQNPARSIQDRPGDNAVFPTDDIWDRATPDDSFSSETGDSEDEEGEDLPARDTPFGDRERQGGDSQTTRDEGINAELFCAAQKGRCRMNKSVKTALNKFLSAQRKALMEFCVQHDVRLATAERYANSQIIVEKVVHGSFGGEVGCVGPLYLRSSAKKVSVF